VPRWTPRSPFFFTASPPKKGRLPLRRGSFAPWLLTWQKSFASLRPASPRQAKSKSEKFPPRRWQFSPVLSFNKFWRLWRFPAPQALFFCKLIFAMPLTIEKPDPDRNSRWLRCIECDYSMTREKFVELHQIGKPRCPNCGRSLNIYKPVV
jgi:hypothetical protein